MAESNWRRSTRCSGGNCVEYRSSNGNALLRDSKNPEGPVLQIDPLAWSDFAGAVKAGEFDE